MTRFLKQGETATIRFVESLIKTSDGSRLTTGATARVCINGTWGNAAGTLAVDETDQWKYTLHSSEAAARTLEIAIDHADAVGPIGGSFTLLDPVSYAAQVEGVEYAADGGRIWFVDDASGDDSNAGTRAAPLATIAAAISAQAAGDTIIVLDGTYDESPTFSKPVTVIGQSWSAMISQSKSAGAPLVTITADHVHLKNLRINDTGLGVAVLANGGSNLWIEGCRIHGGSDGFVGNFTTAARGCRLHRNWFSANWDGAVLGRWLSGLEVIGNYFETDGTYTNGGTPLPSCHACTCGATTDIVATGYFRGNTFAVTIGSSANVNDSSAVRCFNAGESFQAVMEGNAHYGISTKSSWAGTLVGISSVGSSNGTPFVRTSGARVHLNQGGGSAATLYNLLGSASAGLSSGYIVYDNLVALGSGTTSGDNVRESQVGSVVGNVGGNVNGTVTLATSQPNYAPAKAGDQMNLADGAITASKIASAALTAAKFASGAFDAVWNVTTRLLTAGTNIVLAKGAGITGFNDLDAAGVRSAVGLSSADLDEQLGDIQSTGDSIDANTLTILDNTNTIEAKTSQLDFTGTGGALKSESTNMRGTDNALLAASYTAPPSASTVANAVAAQSDIAGALSTIGTNLDAKVSEAGGAAFPLEGDALTNFQVIFGNNGNTTTKYWDNLTAPKQITVQVGN